MTFAVEVHASVRIAGLDRGALEKVFFGMGNVLCDAEAEVADLLDHAVSVDLGEKLVTIDVTARGKTINEADTLAKAAVLLAMKATGGAPANAAQLRKFALDDSSRVVDALAAHDVDVVSNELALA